MGSDEAFPTAAAAAARAAAAQRSQWEPAEAAAAAQHRTATATAMPAGGTPVWLPAGDGWIAALKVRDSVAEGQLVGSEGLVVCLREDSGEELVVPRDVLSHRELLSPGGGVDDLTQLAFLNEASILDNLRSRYEQSGDDPAQRPRIYTYCGRICLAANPFQPVRALSYCPAPAPPHAERPCAARTL